LPEGARTAMTFVLSQSSAEHRALLSSSLSSPAREGDTLHLVSEEGWLVPASRLLLALHSPSLSSLLTSSLASTVSVPSTAASLSSLLSLLSSSSSPPSSLSHLEEVKELVATLGLHLPELALEPAIPTTLATTYLTDKLESSKKAKKFKLETTIEEAATPPFESILKADSGPNEPNEGKDESEVEWPCNYCSKSFQQINFLEDHHNMKHPEQSLVEKKIFQCQSCPKFFTTRKPFNKHKGKHLIGKGGLRHCKKCSEVFNGTKDLMVHIKSSHPKSNIENTAAIERNLQLIKTFENKADEHLLESEYESVTFDDATEATQGLQEARKPGTTSDSGTGPKSLYLEASESVGESRTPFEDGNNFRPVESQTSENVPVGKSGKVSSGLPEESLTSALEENVWYQEEWICGLCAKIFSGENFVNIHLEKKHIGETKRSTKIFACKKCTKSFAVLQNMEAHLRTHSTPSPSIE